MILRPFTATDLQIISFYQYPGMSEDDILATIHQWNTYQYDGRYFTQLAIDVDGQIVGYVSLFEQSDGTASEGVEIYPPFRRNGYAFDALNMLARQAKDLGYTKMVAQIRQDNVASLALHEKLGFVITDHFTNKRGNPVCSLSLSLL